MSVGGFSRRGECWQRSDCVRAAGSAGALLLWTPYCLEPSPSADREVLCFKLVLTTQL